MNVLSELFKLNYEREVQINIFNVEPVCVIFAAIVSH